VVLVTEDFTASGCDGWTLEGAGLTLHAVDTCGVSACEICAANVDAGGFAGTYYPTKMLDGGSYTVSGWLLDRDAGSVASYTLQASFFTESAIWMGGTKTTGSLASDWGFVSSPATTNVEPGATQAQVGVTSSNMQVGGCMRVTHVRVAWAP
jgi:hypothetical protein